VNYGEGSLGVYLTCVGGNSSSIYNKLLRDVSNVDANSHRTAESFREGAPVGGTNYNRFNNSGTNYRRQFRGPGCYNCWRGFERMSE